MGSRIHREMYVRFRGEAMETCLGDKARRCGLSLLSGHHNSIPDVLERVLCAGEIASEGRWRHGGKYEYARNEGGKHQSVPFRYDWKCLYYRGYRRCGGIIQPGTLCVGRSGHRKESDEAYRRTYKCKSEKYDAGSCFKSYRISKRKLYPHR